MSFVSSFAAYDSVQLSANVEIGGTDQTLTCSWKKSSRIL